MLTDDERERCPAGPGIVLAELVPGRPTSSVRADPAPQGRPPAALPAGLSATLDCPDQPYALLAIGRPENLRRRRDLGARPPSPGECRSRRRGPLAQFVAAGVGLSPSSTATGATNVRLALTFDGLAHLAADNLCHRCCQATSGTISVPHPPPSAPRPVPAAGVTASTPTDFADEDPLAWDMA